NRHDSAKGTSSSSGGPGPRTRVKESGSESSSGGEQYGCSRTEMTPAGTEPALAGRQTQSRSQWRIRRLLLRKSVGEGADQPAGQRRLLRLGQGQRHAGNAHRAAPGSRPRRPVAAEIAAVIIRAGRKVMQYIQRRAKQRLNHVRCNFELLSNP